MQGYQFAHIDIWSRQGAAKKGDAGKTHRASGQKAWTVAQILDEAERVPGACGHVPVPRPPLIIPGSCADFDELRAAHDAACAVRQAFPYTNPKTGKKSTRRRAFRKDSPSLYSAVFSLPMTAAEALADPAKLARCQVIFDACIAFERLRIEDAGGEVALSVIHLDEAQVHLHLYALDRGSGTVKALHPGHAALADAGLERGAARERATRAYCDAMRGWQNDLHREVMGPAGLLRFGPGRERLSRAEYQRRKQAQKEAAKAKEVIGDSLALARSVRAAGDAVREREDLIARKRAELDARDIAQEGAHRDLLGREMELFEREMRVSNQSNALAARAKAHAEKVAAEEAALTKRAATLAAREARAQERESALAAREVEAGQRIRREEKRAADATAATEAHRDSMADKERKADAAFAGIEAVMEGFFVLDTSSERARLVPSPKAGEQPSRWQALRERLSGAKEVAGVAANWLLRQRDQMLRDTRDELLRDYSALGGVMRFAQALITRIPPAERAQTRVDLERAAKGEIANAVVLQQGDTPRLSPRRRRGGDAR